MIVNFLSNAVKFSPVGSQIVIHMTERDPCPRISNTDSQLLSPCRRVAEMKHRRNSRQNCDGNNHVEDDRNKKRKGNVGFWSYMATQPLLIGNQEDCKYHFIVLHYLCCLLQICII